jgi:hypothetical protein
MGRVYNPPPRTVEEVMSDLRRDGWTFRPTTDDWHPSWSGDLVGMRFLIESSGARIQFKGGDDTRMERAFTDETLARRCYLRLPVVISRDDLRDLGFVWA